MLMDICGDERVVMLAYLIVAPKRVLLLDATYCDELDIVPVKTPSLRQVICGLEDRFHAA
jgi:hypothetical protein